MSLFNCRGLILSLVLCLLSGAPAMGWQDQDKNLESNRLSFLANPEIQKDVELLPEQVEQLEALQTEAGEVFEKLFSAIQEDLRELSAEEQKKLVRKTHGQAQEKLRAINDKAYQILLPHQVKRLEQILVQQKIRSGGTKALLDSEFFRDRVGLTDDEVSALRKKEKEVIEQRQKEIAEIKEKAWADVLSVLPKEKQEKFESMIGETFRMPTAESKVIDIFSFLRDPK